MQIKITRTLVFALFIVTGLQLQAQNVWRHRACLPPPGGPVANFAIGNLGYVLGSLTNGRVTQLWQYNPQTDIWTQKNNFPGAQFGMSVFVINDTAYAGCGQDTLGNYRADFWKYNATNDTWTPIAPFMGAVRYTAMAFALNGMGYVGCGKGGNEYNDFYQYNPATDVWTQKASFPGSDRQTGVGLAAGGFGYMGFGYDGTNCVNDFYKYNPNNNTWSAVASLDSLGRSEPGWFVINDTIYVAGGASLPDVNGIAALYFDDCWRYDLESNTWISEPGFACLSPVRAACQGFTINGHGYLTCGSNTVNHFHDVLEFGPIDTAFTERVHVLGHDSNYCNSFNRQVSVSDSCAVWSTGYIGSGITINSAGTYWVRINDSCGVSSDTLVIAHAGLPIADSIQNASCGSNDGSAGIIPLGGIAPYNYIWSNGNTSSNITNVAAGIYAVTVSDLSNCSSTITVIINTSGNDSVSISANKIEICSNDSARICATAGFDSYQWNDGQSGTCIYTSLAGNYYVTATGPGNCSAESNHVKITVLPVPPVAISVNGDTLTCYSGLQDQWYFNNDSIPGATSNIYIAKALGSYTVFIVDSDGCSTTSSAVILPTEVTGISAGAIKIYPNPLSTGNWTIETDNTTIGATAEIYDADGRLVYAQQITSPRFPIDLNPPSGIYTLRILSANKYVVQKLIKL